MSEKRVFKYRLREEDSQDVLMPKGAEILCVQTQSGLLQLWAMADPLESDRQDREIVIVGTGNPILEPDRLRYIGTTQQSVFVWHVFERMPPAPEAK